MTNIYPVSNNSIGYHDNIRQESREVASYYDLTPNQYGDPNADRVILSSSNSNRRMSVAEAALYGSAAVMVIYGIAAGVIAPVIAVGAAAVGLLVLAGCGPVVVALLDKQKSPADGSVGNGELDASVSDTGNPDASSISASSTSEESSSSFSATSYLSSSRHSSSSSAESSSSGVGSSFESSSSVEFSSSSEESSSFSSSSIGSSSAGSSSSLESSSSGFESSSSTSGVPTTTSSLSTSSSASYSSSSSSAMSSSSSGVSSGSSGESSSSSAESSSLSISGYSSSEEFSSSSGEVSSSSIEFSSSSVESSSSSFGQDAGTPIDAGAVDASIVCSPLPLPVDLTTPSSGATNISVHPSFGWTTSVGQGISYILQVDDDPGFNSPEINQINWLTNQYTATETLVNNRLYFWRVIAQDSCLNSASSTISNFTTERLCTQPTYTDFTSWASLNVVVNAGIVSLAKDQSVWNCYDGNVLPDTVGWAGEAPFGWPLPPTSTGGILELTTEDINGLGYFWKNIPFDSSVGWMVETRKRLVNNQGASGCGLRIQDDRFMIDFRFMNDRVGDGAAVRYQLMDPRTDFNTYLFAEKDGALEISINGALNSALSGQAAANTDTGYIWFHDLAGTFDSHAFWDYVCYYTGGNVLPYVSSGTYISQIINTGSIINNVGNGATISWSQTTPAGTSIEMQVCASNDPDMIVGVSCESGLTNNAGEIIPPTVNGQYVRFVLTLKTLDNQLTPQADGVTFEYETCE